MTPDFETVSRDQIRDLVARYNANGDAGRFAQLIELFADDAVLEIRGTGSYRGADEILTVFTGARDRLTAATSELPTYVRHFTSTHQIDLVDDTRAEGRCYFAVITPVGLDHWGRYIDTYTRHGDRWLFQSRTVTVDGYAPGSLYHPS